MAKKYFTEKEIIVENKCNMHLIEQNVLDKRYSIEEFSEIIPGIVHINCLDDFAINFVNSFGEKKYDVGMEEVLKVGPSFILDLFEPGSFEILTKPLANMVAEDDKSKIISFFQKIKPHKNADYRWLLTTSKILKDKNEFISISQELNGIDGSTRAIGKVLDDNLFLKKNMERFGTLTKREKEIVKLVVQGNSTKQISERLFLSAHTVSTHRKNIIRKLELKSIHDWERFAYAFDL